MGLMSLAWKEILHRRSHLISGTVAITLGVAAIVGIRSVTRVSEIAVAKRLDNLGANILVLPQAASVDDYYTADIDAPTMPQEFVERILSSTLPGVDNLSPKLTRRMDVSGKPVVVTGILPASEIASKPVWQSAGLVGAELAVACDPDASANASLGYEDEKLQRKAVDSLGEDECLVGSAAAGRLGLVEGASATVSGRAFKVDKILPETGTVDDDRLFVHLSAVQAMTGIPDRVSAIEIMGCCKAISDGLLSKLRNILPDTRITTVKQIVATQADTNRLMGDVSTAFLFLVLFVGAVSIGNFLWANVNERRKEIGILRMLGAPRARVHAMFVAKAAFLGLLGGVLGFVVGSLAALWLGPSFVGLPVRPVPAYLAWAVPLAVGTAVLGSLVPAWIAGRIEPFASMQET